MGRPGPSLRGVLVVWALYAAVTAAIVVTYSTTSTRDLYHVSREGIAGGASRALGFSNFSLAFAALAILGIVMGRLLSDPIGIAPRSRRIDLSIAALAAVLCLATALPGVVDQADLDAKPINAVPAAGVLLVIALTVYALRSRGVGASSPRLPGDPIRCLAIAVMLVIALPWILADLGVYAGDVPLLGHFFMSKQVSPGDALRDVHLGHHHGLDGTFLAISALILGRELGRVGAGWLRNTLAWYLPLMVAYGVANAANDAWLEQIVKRGWTDWRIPSMLRPGISIAWGLVVLAVVVLRILAFRPEPLASETDSGAPNVGGEFEPKQMATSSR